MLSLECKVYKPNGCDPNLLTHARVQQILWLPTAMAANYVLSSAHTTVYTCNFNSMH